MTRANLKTRACFFLIAVVFICSNAAAQEIEKNELLDLTLEELMNLKVRTATKTDIVVSKSPGAVTVITYAQIQESSARSLPELLRLVAGVNVRWNPMMQTIDMRGFGQNPFTSRVLLSIDGVPYNSWNKGGFPQQPGFDFFVLQNVKRVEVIRGPSSSLYGENAYWGVINIVTLSGEDLDGGKIEVYAGERETRSASAIYGQKIKDGSFLVSAKFLQSQFPTEFWFEENDSKVRGSDIFIKGQYKALQLSYYRHNDDVDGFEEPIPDPSFPPGAAFRSVDKIEQTVDIAALKYEYKLPSEYLRFAGDVSLARRNGMHCAGCHALPQDSHFSGKENHGYQLIGNFLTEVNYLPHQQIVLGVEGRRVESKSHGDELLQVDPLTGKNSVLAYSKFAAFFQDQISLANDRLQIIAGARYDGKTNPKLWGDRLSPRVAAVFNPNDKLTFRGGWNRAFHFPDFSSLYQNTWFFNVSAGPVAIPLSQFSPNPNLKPEEIENFDLGLEYQYRPNLSMKVDLYRSRVKNFIVLAFTLPPPPAVGTVGFENHPDIATIWGSEIELRWDIKPGVRGVVNWAYQDQDQKGNLLDSSGKPFEFVYAPKHKINLGGYFGPFAGVRGALEVAWRDEFLFPSFWNLLNSGFTDPSIGQHDGYALVNLRLSYELPFLSGRTKRWLRFNFYARNLLDEKPNETVIGVNNSLAGREFFGGLEFRLGLK
jgi:iron complex outermembrane receptor protein